MVATENSGRFLDSAIAGGTWRGTIKKEAPAPGAPSFRNIAEYEPYS